MRRERSVTLGALAAILAIALLGGCAPRIKAPEGWLPDAHEALHDPYGGWIRLQMADDAARDEDIAEVRVEEVAQEFSVVDLSPHWVYMIQGEFLGLSADSVFVLAGDDSVRTVYRPRVIKADVAFFDPLTSGVQGWATFGGLSTLSHSYFLVISAPLWGLVGSVAATAHANTAINTLEKNEWEEMNAYARFPQGPPPGLRDLDLRMRPAPDSPPPKNEW